MKSSIGIDIRDESLKFAELIADKNGIRVGRYGELKIPAGVIEQGIVKEPKRLEEILKSLKKDFGLKSGHISTYNTVNKDYLSTFKNSKIIVKSLESQMQALARSVIKKGNVGTYMIVNFGGKNVDIFIVSNGVEMPVSTFEFNEDNGIAANIIEKKDRISKHFLHWHTHKDKNEDRLPIDKIILAGNEPSLTDFAEYLSVSLRHKAEVADVWVNIVDTEKNIPDMNFEQSAAFASALGLALKDF